MSEELEELNLEDYVVDEATGEVRVVRAEDTPIDAPKDVKGSASLITNYMQCPAKAYGSMTRQPQTKGVSLLQGIAIHAGLERYTKFEEDPVEVFNKTLIYEAERNKMLLDGKDGDEARKVGAICIAAGKTLLDSKGVTGIELRKRIRPEYVERAFQFIRNGRRYVGKIDGIVFPQIGDAAGGYVPYDWKSGKNPPSDLTFGARVPREADLKADVQFTIYAEGPRVDPTMPETFGKLPTRLTYIHLRGRSNERHPSGKRKAVKDSETPPQYDFPTTRTQEEIDTHFATVIDPVMGAMESGLYYRHENHKFNCNMCGFFDRDKLRCKVELPADSKERIKNAREAQQQSERDHAAKDAAESETLFGKQSAEVIEQSRKAGLKPYSG